MMFFFPPNGLLVFAMSRRLVSGADGLLYLCIWDLIGTALTEFCVNLRSISSVGSKSGRKWLWKIDPPMSNVPAMPVNTAALLVSRCQICSAY